MASNEEFKEVPNKEELMEERTELVAELHIMEFMVFEVCMLNISVSGVLNFT